jgi:type VI secretion system protein
MPDPRNNHDRHDRVAARRLIAFLLVFVLAAGHTACGITRAPKAVYLRARALAGGDVDVTVNIASDANRNSPIAVAVLVVYDEDLMAKLLQMTAAQWFEQRMQLRRDFKDGEGFDSWEWEWVPGQRIPVQSLPLKPPAKGALVFADYAVPGIHRFRIDPFKDIVIHLKETAFTVETEESFEDRMSESKIFTDTGEAE